MRLTKREISVVYGSVDLVGYKMTPQLPPLLLSHFIASPKNDSTGPRTFERLSVQTLEAFRVFGRLGDTCDTITDKITTLSTPSMITPQPFIRETSTNDADITYVTDNARDAEVLQHQTEKPVRIQSPATETFLCGFTEIRIRKQFFSRDARNASDV